MTWIAHNQLWVRYSVFTWKRLRQIRFKRLATEIQQDLQEAYAKQYTSDRFVGQTHSQKLGVLAK